MKRHVDQTPQDFSSPQKSGTKWLIDGGTSASVSFPSCQPWSLSAHSFPHIAHHSPALAASPVPRAVFLRFHISLWVLESLGTKRTEDVLNMSMGNLLLISHSEDNLPVQVKRCMPFLSGHTLISSQIRKYLLCSPQPSWCWLLLHKPPSKLLPGQWWWISAPSWSPGMRKLRDGGAWRKLEREEPLKNAPLV